MISRDEDGPLVTRGRSDSGFTLIEVLVVVAILALSVGIIAGRGPARSPGLEARGAADQVARGLRLARSRAIAGNHAVAFTLDVARRSFRVGDAPWQALPPTLDLGMLAAAEAAPDPALGRIVFAPDGGATGGSIRVGALTIGVDWLSGRVTVADARR